ncbi:ANTAR domain-containing protein [Cryobacterium sp. SO1]|uniref:ANTAR domain-containing protein n=1 Tax=Cryobacterium sp. SO1 TaxID=1897061 RepID=UPI00102307E5|nr:ANTAR domain-containing protein [Cryobacterium sp. SO1]
MSIESHQQFKLSTSWYNPEVHQATGVIIAQTHTDPDDALRRLVGYAEATGLLVDAVAADVIACRITFI